MPLVMQLGNWVELHPSAEKYLCERCKTPVSLGNDGHAISHPNNEWSYVHYHCAPDVPTKRPSKRRKQATQ